MYYLLDTPIGLFDRHPHLADKVANWTRFISHLRFLFTSTDPEDYQWFWRFRPFFDVWHGLIWHHFGDSFLHYANRLLFAFGTLAFLIAAFRRVCKSTPCAKTPYQVLPLAVLAYVWLFFPNGAFVLKETVELYTVFFLSVCNYAAALMLMGPAGKGGMGHAIFAFGFLGLLLSKEPNVALAPWLLVCYLAIAKASGRLFAGWMVGAILGMASLVVLERILLFVEANTVRGGEYFIPAQPILTRFFDNAPIIIEGITQYHTNPVMTPAILLMLGCLAFFARRSFDRKELAFIILLIGEFASLFLVLSISHGTERRYWSVLIPLLASLLAFAAKHLLDVAKWSRELTQSTAIGLTAFIGLFVLSNYSNFLFQFISQHSERNLDQSMIDQAVLLVDNNEYVSVVTNDGLQFRAADLVHLAATRYGSDRIHRTPPDDPRTPYYIIDMGGDGLPHDVKPRVTSQAYFAGPTDYRILDYAATLSGFLQGRRPYASLPSTAIAPLGDTKYGIYAVAPNGSGDLVLSEKEAAEERH